MNSQTKNEEQSVRRGTHSQPSLFFSTSVDETITQEFEIFWQSFPRRVGKLAALREYKNARAKASAAEILAGVERYRRSKPEYADWCHPRTFLFQGRWMDEPDEPAQVTAKVDWFEECKALHGGACGLSQQRHAERKWADAFKAREAS